MFSKTSDCISVSLNEDIFKVAQIKGGGSSSKVTSVVTMDVKGVAEAELPKTIQSSLKGFNVKSSEVVCVIPPSQATTKNIEIPSTNPEEIESIISLQAGRHTPFSREEVQIGYVNLGVFKSNYTKVLLVIVSRSVIKQQLGVFEKAGLKVKKVLFAPEGIATFYSAALNLQAEATPTGIIDIGKQSTDFVVIHKGLALTTRNIPIGKNQLDAEGASAQEKLVEELGKTMESYTSEDIEQAPSKYILTSDDNYNKELESVLTQKLSWPTEVSPYVDHIKASQGTLKQLATDFGDSSLLNIIAPGTSVSNAQINLIPDEVQLQKSVADQGREVFKAAILGFIILILVAAGLGTRIYFRNNFLTNLKTNYQDNRSKVVSLEERSIKTKVIQNYLANRMIALDTINELYEKIPNNVYLTGLFMDEEGTINIQGISDIASVVFNLGTTLKESELFKSVNIQSTKAKKDRGKDVSAFEITLKLISADDDEMDAEESLEEE